MFSTILLVVLLFLLPSTTGAATESPVVLTAFSFDGSKVFAASRNGLLRLWDRRTGRLLLSRRVKTSRGLDYTACNGRLFYGADYKSVRVWSIENLSPVSIFPYEGGYVEALAISPDGKWLAKTDYIGRADMMSFVNVVDAKTGVFKNLMRMPRDEILFGPGTSLAYSLDGRLLAWGGRDSALRIWEASKGELLGYFPCIPENQGPEGITQLQFSPRGTLLAVAREGTVFREDNTPMRGAEVALLDYRGDAIIGRFITVGKDKRSPSICFSPDGRFLAIAGSEGTIKVVDVENRTLKKTMASYGTSFTFIAWNCGRTHLVSGDSDGNVTLWEWQSGEGKALP